MKEDLPAKCCVAQSDCCSSCAPWAQALCERRSKGPKRERRRRPGAIAKKPQGESEKCRYDETVSFESSMTKQLAQLIGPSSYLRYSLLINELMYTSKKHIHSNNTIWFIPRSCWPFMLFLDRSQPALLNPQCRLG